MILEIVILVVIIAIFVIFARHLPEIKQRIKWFDQSKESGILEKNENGENKKTKGFFAPKDFLQEGLKKGDKFFRDRNFIKAEEEYLKLATQDPKNPKIYNRLGALYLEQGDYSDAKQSFKEAINFDKKIGSRWYNLALAQIGLKEYRSAINSLVQAVKLEKKNKKYLETLKDVRGRLKRIKPIKASKSNN